ncbi:hypothetical protein L3C95_18075 [Chitinophaga filiformis]|uniref:hypothetical protein n=1 Tax=Chitinophaga filiformis TaxID=104663 RepID=UPI001F38B2DD|nr:hypothetical protein [Chitinophaga filiformis]MCF6404812.1 hypothetical protein [Chitinophaga filiformis]
MYKKADIDIKGDESSAVRYFLSKINQLHLHNLVEGYNEKPVSREILEDIRSIDLDDSIHKELDIFVDPDVRHYLIEIKEENLFTKAEKQISDIYLRYITKKKNIDDSGYLNEIYLSVYSHFHKNLLVFDAFSNFTDLVTEVIECMVQDYNAAGEEETFNVFYLTEAILYVSNDDLTRILRDCRNLRLEASERSAFIKKATNFLSSVYIETSYGIVEDRNMAEQLLNYSFEDKYTRIFSNLFLVLSNIEPLPEVDRILAKPISSFIDNDKNIQQHEIKTLCYFIERYGMIFEFYQLEEMLNKCVKTDGCNYSRYKDLPAAIGRMMHQHHPEDRISDSSLIRRAVANWTSSDGRANLIYHLDLYYALKEGDAEYLLHQVEMSLENNFHCNLYFHVVDLKIIDWDHKDYFGRYVKYVQGNKQKGFTGFNDKGPICLDTHVINLILWVYHHNIDISRRELGELKNMVNLKSGHLILLNLSLKNSNVNGCLQLIGTLCLKN